MMIICFELVPTQITIQYSCVYGRTTFLPSDVQAFVPTGDL
jgi:hypothetical protein